LGKGASYVSKSGTAVDVLIHKTRQYKIVTQGSGSAWFHECSACGDVVCVTVQIDGTIYGALNAQCMKNKLGFPVAEKTDLSGQTITQKRDRWRQNWCHPVTITSPDSKTPTVPLPEASGPVESV
jgi:hypothetical protein